MTTPTEREELLLKEMRHIAGISNGQVKRVADAVLAQCGQQTVAPIIRATEREALIARLRVGYTLHQNDTPDLDAADELMGLAADMLEADAQEKHLQAIAKFGELQNAHQVADADDAWHRGRAAGIEECERVNAEMVRQVAVPQGPVREHTTDGKECWCHPEVHYIDPITGVAVIVHNKPN